MALKRTNLLPALLAALLLLPGGASALEYRSVSVPKAVLYDAPSGQGKKLFIVNQGYPLEVIVNLGDWIKVRDSKGGLNWIESKQVSTGRTVIVISAQADIYQDADQGSPVIGKVSKDVVLDLVETAGNGWVKVRHRDGLVGYLPNTSVWGY